MSRQVEIRAPAEQTEGTRSQILRWLKSIGEDVAENEPLIEIETDKVTVEVASPGTGTLREIVKQEQEEIAPGELLGTIEATGAYGVDHQDVAAVVGGAADVTHRMAAAGHEAAASNGSATLPRAAIIAGAAPTSGAASTSDATATAPHSLSPAVRRLISERGLDPAEVRGTGQGGRITVADVLSHNAGIRAPSAPTESGVTPATASGARAAQGADADGDLSARGTGADGQLPASGTAADGQPARRMGAGGQQPAQAQGMGTATAPGATAATAPGATGPARRVPHTPTRKRIAEHMVQSLLHTAPHVTTVFEADLGAVLDHRERNKEAFAQQRVPLTFTAYFLQATVAAIRAVPEANSRWSDDALEIFDSMHIGVATALESGLVVPVLRDVQSRDLFETARGLEDLVSRAREGRLSPADVRGGTFTISNHGVSGSLVATPIIINQPQSAILGVGKLEKRPVVVSDGGEDHLAIRPRCYVTLTIDHRVMDGHQANRFLQTLVERLARPDW
jgi:2-oxoglutarate dehydrogenase E2 component (dihydrolipoamide succinyltransferase)